MKDARVIIKQNQQLQKANELVTAENTRLKEKISTIDETAINKLRQEKDEEIARLMAERDKALSNEIHSNNMASRERQRADDAESRLNELLTIPEIKEIWDGIQQNRRAFQQQIDKWIGEATAAIRHFAQDYGHNDFIPEQRNAVAMGIIAKAFKCNLDASDNGQRMKATQYLLDEVSWDCTTDFMSELAKTRTRQLCEEMNVTKELMRDLLLMAGGRVSVSTGGGNSDNALTTWDGKKKRNGWGLV